MYPCPTLVSFLAVILSILLHFGVLALQDVTNDLFGGENVGKVAAFGDFNSDKQTDVFVIRDGKWTYIYFL